MRCNEMSTPVPRGSHAFFALYSLRRPRVGWAALKAPAARVKYVNWTFDSGR